MFRLNTDYILIVYIMYHKDVLVVLVKEWE